MYAKVKEKVHMDFGGNTPIKLKVQQNSISRCSSDGRARDLGSRGRGFETRHLDHKSKKGG